MKQPCASAARLRGAGPFRRRHHSHSKGPSHPHPGSLSAARHESAALRRNPGFRFSFSSRAQNEFAGLGFVLRASTCRSGSPRGTTPCGISPIVTMRHNPMSSLRASATTPEPAEVFVLRAPVSTLARYHCTSALSLLEQEEPPRELDQAAAHAGVAGFSQSLLASLGTALRGRARNSGVSGHGS